MFPQNYSNLKADREAEKGDGVVLEDKDREGSLAECKGDFGERGGKWRKK